ncbi:uncharacterized protein LOC135226949 [Macrobrachium nipponense]|uniref:uncharacterized protein LOC135226949 n=1 Tax=Macrobrachium nipponense TaxID=159736 RepID=UPI0030C822EA
MSLSQLESDPSTSQSLVQDAQQEAESDVINAEPKDTEQQRDIGLIPDRPSRVQIEDFVRQGPQPIPSQIASDDKGNSFPYTVLKVQRPNEHEHTNYHKQCYLDWRQLEARLKEESGIDDQLQRSIQSEKSKWKLILKRILDVVLTLGERGLSFQGESSMICDTNNGNFLGIIELLSRYDPILQDHVSKVREAQKDGKRRQAHYLSYSSQNEFIQLCAEKVKDCILNERDQAKYYSIMVDATPDMSHTEQSTFILRYLTCDECEISQLKSLTAKTKVDVAAAIKYVSSFECILMAAFWFKLLNSIDQRNQVIQAQSSTVDIEVKNIEDLETELQSLKKKWHLIYDEAKVVVVAMNIDPVFRVTRKGKRKSFFDDSDSDDDKVSGEDSLIQTDEHRFKKEVFFKVIDTVCERLNKRYQAIFQINKLFGFLWSYLDMTDEVIVNDSKTFSTEYSKDISSDKLTEEILWMGSLRSPNGRGPMTLTVPGPSDGSPWPCIGHDDMT